MSLPISEPASAVPIEGRVRKSSSAKLLSADNKLYILWEDGERLFCREECHAAPDHADDLTERERAEKALRESKCEPR